MMRRFREDDRAARYLDDPEYRTRVNLYLGTAVNAAYMIANASRELKRMRETKNE